MAKGKGKGKAKAKDKNQNLINSFFLPITSDPTPTSSFTPARPARMTTITPPSSNPTPLSSDKDFFKPASSNKKRPTSSASAKAFSSNSAKAFSSNSKHSKRSRSSGNDENDPASSNKKRPTSSASAKAFSSNSAKAFSSNSKRSRSSGNDENDPMDVDDYSVLDLTEVTDHDKPKVEIETGNNGDVDYEEEKPWYDEMDGEEHYKEVNTTQRIPSPEFIDPTRRPVEGILRMSLRCNNPVVRKAVKEECKELLTLLEENDLNSATTQSKY